MSDHDPFNQPEIAHPRSRDLMAEELFWDCADEDAPFGSDEGWTAYYEWRQWREDNPGSSLVDCFSWILNDRLDEYNDSLSSDERIAADLESPDDAFLSEAFDIFTLDTTIIGTALGQLLDEGMIDVTAKPYVQVAIARQLNPRICESDARREILLAVKRVIEKA
ncbi:molybdate metabolism regulator [Haloferula sp. BvORR071]|uniref:molybdate metabolism regulator n=1 Tax=Haloferula sp. BvORR071 TaxID=1396141 RepID=UPI0005580A4B|nr:molybdate metabolism regulator [Haloferula sp. BvORR071]